jgi:hypothetical protein
MHASFVKEKKWRKIKFEGIELGTQSAVLQDIEDFIRQAQSIMWLAARYDDGRQSRTSAYGSTPTSSTYSSSPGQASQVRETMRKGYSSCTCGAMVRDACSTTATETKRLHLVMPRLAKAQPKSACKDMICTDLLSVHCALNEVGCIANRYRALLQAQAYALALYVRALKQFRRGMDAAKSCLPTHASVSPAINVGVYVNCTESFREKTVY